MKNIRLGFVYSFLLITFTLFTRSHTFANVASFSISPLQQVVQGLNSPNDIAKFLKKNFKFKEDQNIFGTLDHWQAPEEFLERRVGDCEDYALFSKYALTQKGFEAYVVSLYGPTQYAHTITVYKNENDRFNVINQDHHYAYEAPSIEKALSKVNRDWIWAGIAKRNGTRGWMMQRLENHSKKSNKNAGSFRSNFSDFPF